MQYCQGFCLSFPRYILTSFWTKRFNKCRYSENFTQTSKTALNNARTNIKSNRPLLLSVQYLFSRDFKVTNHVVISRQILKSLDQNRMST